MQNIKRIVIINDASVARGGATGLAVSLANALADKRVPVTFFSGANDGRGYLNSDIELVEVGGKHLLEKNAVKSLFSGLFNYPSFIALYRWIKKYDEPGTIYHVHGWSKYLSPSIFLALRGVWDRVVVHAHDFFMACPNGGYVNYKTGQVCELNSLSFKCFLSNCDKRSYSHKIWRSIRSCFLKAFISGLDLKGKILILHKGMLPYFRQSSYSEIDFVEVVNPSGSYTDARVRSEDNTNIFYIGRLDEEKGILDLAKAAKSAGVRLEIIGEGAERVPLEKYYPEFKIHGWLGKTEISNLVKHARAVVVPSRYPEPFGLVITESIKSGIPVILKSDAILAPEIEEKGLGYAYPNKGAELSDFLKKIKNESTGQMSQRCFEVGNKIYPNYDTWLQRLIDKYEHMLVGNMDVQLNSQEI